MCGVCGVVGWNSPALSEQNLRQMTSALEHRGPDDEGFYFSPDSPHRAVFGFRRLSIIDLALGHQPMRYGPWAMVFNGEIYNYRELREKYFAGEKLQTQSDTEVLLRLLASRGAEALREVNGMFAVALWNEQTAELILARDRLGIKPLYYFYNGKTCAFASEIKSLARSGLFALEIDPTALQDYLSYRFVSAPHTLCRSVAKVAPGEYLKISERGLGRKKYWQVAAGSVAAENPLEELDRLLQQSIDRQMISDVPVGAFLSGGVDSSLIVALAARRTSKLQTFSVAFEAASAVDESPFAREVAAFCGTQHSHLLLSSSDLLRAESVLQKMAEPVADPTVLPTALLAEEARKSVKVVLTGEGADELFAGYNRYKALLYNEWLLKFPEILRTPMAGVFRKFGRGSAFRAIPDLSAASWTALQRDFSLEKIQSLLPTPSEKTYVAPPLQAQPLLNAALAQEIQTSLAERLLLKVDMATMGASLEARPPFLDHELVEWAMQLPSRWKVHRFKGKYILRVLAERYLPKKIAWRRKHGFIVPLEFWWKNSDSRIRELLLDFSAQNEMGVWNASTLQALRQKAAQNSDGEAIARLWPVAILNLWLKSLKS